jgi:hypothetical protein
MIIIINEDKREYMVGRNKRKRKEKEYHMNLAALQSWSFPAISLDLHYG